MFFEVSIGRHNIGVYEYQFFSTFQFSLFLRHDVDDVGCQMIGQGNGVTSAGLIMGASGELTTKPKSNLRENTRLVVGYNKGGTY